MTTSQNGTLVTTARNATLEELAGILATQRARQRDIVIPGRRLIMRNGMLVVPDSAATLTDTGVDTAAGEFRLLKSFDAGLADKLGIPLRWVRWMRENRTDMLDTTVNKLLHGGSMHGNPIEVNEDGTWPDGVYPPSQARYLLRTFTGDDGQPGIARALLSDSYNPIDSYDILFTAIKVINEARDKAVREALGMDPDAPVTPEDAEMAGQLGGLAAGVEIAGINLTEDGMWLRAVCPGVTAPGGALTDGYRTPFQQGGITRAGGYQPPQSFYRPRNGDGGKPKVGDLLMAGWDFRTNEVGQGAFEIIPIVWETICSNGLTVPSRKLRAVHLGGKLDDGEIIWSDATQRKATELVMAKTGDAIRTFCDAGHLARLAAEMEGRARVEIDDPAETIKVVARKCAISDDDATAILRHFTLGGQLTAAGVVNAVTSVSQTLEDPAAAMELDYKAGEVLTAAADHATQARADKTARAKAEAAAAR